MATVTRRRVQAVEMDERTEGMSLEALGCRSSSHSWLYVLSPARTNEWKRQGFIEFVWLCSRCTTRRSELYTYPGYELQDRKMQYPPGYLIGKQFAGTGRLPAIEAKKAIGEQLESLPDHLTVRAE